MTVVKNVRLFARHHDDEAVDVEFGEGRIQAIRPTAETGGSRLLLPSLGDVHAHLDSNRLGQRFAHTPPMARSTDTS